MGALLEAERRKNGRLSKIIKSANKREGAANARAERLRDKCKGLAREVSDLKMQHGLEVRQLHLTYAEMMNPEENGICDEVLSIRQENKRLREEKSKLEARDRYNDGSHAPGSKKTFAQKQADAEKRKKKKKKAGGKPARLPGGQLGHAGHAHKYGKPDETRYITMNRCGKKSCRCKRLAETHIETVYAEEITRPQKRTIRCIVSRYDCLKCGSTNMRYDDPLLRNGRFGPNVVMQVLVNYLSRMPNRMNVGRPALLAGLLMASGTVANILKRVGNRLTAPANVLAQYMRRARILHVDETSISLNGRLVWMWTFFEPRSGRVLFVMRKSRGRDVPREILGDDWGGTLVADGWRAYARYVVQRCTAHLIREIRNITEKDPGDAHAARALRTFRGILRDAKKKTPKPGRAAAHGRLVQRMKNLISKYRAVPSLKKCMEKIERALPDMFRFVLDPRIPADNNPAERHLREITVHRKVRGSIRSEETMDWMGALFTCVGTWKGTGRDYIEELARYV